MAQSTRLFSMFQPLLDQYIDEGIVSVINIISGNKEPTRGYQNRHTNQILIFGGYHKMIISLCTHVNMLVGLIINHIDVSVILLGYEGSSMLYRPNGTENKNTIKYPYSTNIKKKVKPWL